jgi:hypothetical protein
MQALPCDAVLDACTLWDFREALIKAKALERLFKRLESVITEAGCLSMSGKIVEAAMVVAPKQQNAEPGKVDIKADRIPQAWQNKSAKLGC